MNEPAILDTTETKTETYADFKTDFDAPAPAAADVTVNAHGVEDKSAAPGEHKPEDGSDPSLKQDKVAKRKAEIQREIDDQVRRRETAKREADAEEDRLKKLRPGTPSPKESAVAQPSAAAARTFDGADAQDPEPTQENFADYQEWLDARSAWIGRKEFRKIEHAKTVKAQEDAQAKQQNDARENYKNSVADFESRGTEYAAENPDYPERVAKFKEMKISNETEAFLLWGCPGTEGPAMLDRFMQAPEKLKEIEGLKSPIARFDALYSFKYESRIADLESQLKAKQPPPAPQKSKAPPAGTNLRASGATAPITEESGYDAWKKQSFDPKN